MVFEVIESDSYTIIKLNGELIASHQSGDLLSKVSSLVEEKKVNFVIDLAELNYINSSGLSALLNILNASRKAGGETILLNISDHLMKLLVITKLHSIFTVATNIDDVIVHFEKPADTEIS